MVIVWFVMASKSRLPFSSDRYGSGGFPVLLLCIPVACQAFTLEIASHEIVESCQGPRSLYVRGYGEVVFEAGLDGALVVDPAYASTGRIEVAPPTSGESAAAPSTEDANGAADQACVKITNKTPVLSQTTQDALQPFDPALENPADGWNSVPEAASATLGLIGTLLLFLRHRTKAGHSPKS